MLSIFLVLQGCSNPEELAQGDVTGKVIIPKDAATRTVVAAADADGNGSYEYTVSEVTDPQLLGPVYLGAFSGIDDYSFPYAHPAMGPVISASKRGDTYPYGGTTVGRFDFACYQALACKVTTGRFADYDALLDYFRNEVGQPVHDEYGNEVLGGATMRESCYHYYSATSDDEMAFIGEDNLKFTEEGDNLVADFIIRHVTRVEGMAVWGFMDAPEINTEDTSRNGSFTTCNPSIGRESTIYATTFFEGSSYYDVMNQPSTYIQLGDWVADGQATLSFDAEGNQKAPVEVNLSFELTAE